MTTHTTLLEHSLLIHKKNYGKNHIQTAWVLTWLGSVYRELGDYEKAKEFLEQALLGHKKHYGGNHTRTAGILRSLGQVHLLENHLARAESLINKSLEVFKHNKHPEAYKSLETLAELEVQKTIQSNPTQSKDHLKKAIKYLSQAIEVIRDHFPNNSPHLIRVQEKIKKLKN